MRNVLACFVVLLCATSAAAVNNSIFYLEMGGNDAACAGVVVRIGETNYGVTTGTASHTVGPTASSFSEGSPVSFQPKWFVSVPGCAGNVRDLCPGSQISLQVGSGNVCTVDTQYENRVINYEVSQITSGGQSYWKIVLTSTIPAT